MSSTDYGAKLTKLLDRLSVRDAHPGGAAMEAWTDAILDADQPILNEFVRSFLLWESSVTQARGAARRLAIHAVDLNDLRVSVPEEIAAVLGERHPLAKERAERLHAALADLFRRTHALTLEHVGAMPKREAKVYLDSLEGVPWFVSARVVMACLGGHTMPMDRRIGARLARAGALPEGMEPEAAAEQVQRRVKCGELAHVYGALHAWVDDGEETPDGAPARRRNGNGRAPRVRESKQRVAEAVDNDVPVIRRGSER